MIVAKHLPQHDVTSRSGADQRLYELSEPVPYGHDWDTGKPEGETRYVIVSAVVAMFSGPETYIFPAREDGTILSWSEMDGSYRGGLNHAEAISSAGRTEAV